MLDCQPLTASAASTRIAYCMSSLPKIIVIVGPTAVGKTRLGLELAKKHGGEVLSADSRQIYKEMNIGTGKPVGVWEQVGGEQLYMVEEVPHYGLDFVAPDQSFSVADFKKYGYEKLRKILENGKVPIIVGGTGLYIWSLLDNLDFTSSTEEEGGADAQQRSQLEARELPELLEELKEADPAGYSFVDRANKRRVVRALELARAGRSIATRQKLAPEFQFLQIGLKLPKEELDVQIDTHIDEQIAAGFEAEAQALLAKYNPALPSMSSIGYSQWAQHAAGLLNKNETILAIKVATHRYAKRQITWFKRDKNITWLSPGDIAAAEELVANFLRS